MERAFGVLKSCFTIICGSSYNWHIDTMKNIILACIILHNMIVEDEHDTYNDNIDADYNHIDEEISNINLSWLCCLPANKTLYAYKRSSSTTLNRLGGAYLGTFWSQ